jgi:poly(A) polymerase
LRRDVETYGRRARVAFDADWAADAARRDFTINAIFLAPNGTIDDPVGGLADLRACRVRFVGDPATRIAEDVLRLLRYYRFEARFGTGLGDKQARDACRAAAHLLPTLSGERVAQELVKLLETPDPIAVLQMMQEDGVLAVALAEARRIDRLRRLIEIEPEADPLLRLAALIEVDRESAAALAARLRFSNAWRDRLCGLSPPWPLDPREDIPAQRRALYRLGVERYRDVVLLMAADAKVSRNRLIELLDLARTWTPPVFPLAGRDVTALGVPPGERVGGLLAAVRDWWENGDFKADHAACLAHLTDLLAAP